MSSCGGESAGVPVVRPCEEFDPSNNDNEKIELAYDQNVGPQSERSHDDAVEGSSNEPLLLDEIMAMLNRASDAEGSSGDSNNRPLLLDAVIAALNRASAILNRNH